MALPKTVATIGSSAFCGCTALTSIDLVVGVVRFKVGSGTSVGTIIGALSLFVDDMVSSASVKRADDMDGLLFSVDGTSTTSSVVVVAPSHVGLLAYVAGAYEQELVNLARLGGSSLASTAHVPITVQAIRSCHTTGGRACSEGNGMVVVTASSCVSSNAAIAGAMSSAAGCRLDALTDAHTMGGDVVVTVTHGIFTALVPFRVWYPSSVTIEAADTTLNRIATPGCTDGIAPALYQHTRLTAKATLEHASSGSRIVDVDVTQHAEFSVEPSSGVALLEAGVLKGVAAGDVTIGTTWYQIISQKA